MEFDSLPTDGSNIIVIVSFFEHIVAAGSVAGIINAISIINFFIRFFLSFCCWCVSVADLIPPLGEGDHEVVAGVTD